MTSRSELVVQFLNQHFSCDPYELVAITGDASFRRYYRVLTPTNSYILMDAPTDNEDCSRFVATCECLAQQGLSVPHIFAKDVQQGLLLLSDLGMHTLQPFLTAESVETWYRLALALLPKIRQAKATSQGALPTFDRAFVERELLLCPEWFLSVHLQLTLQEEDWQLWHRSFELLIQSALEQPAFGMHRDFHSRNLMVLPENELAVIDFQDMVQGPVTYDAVSLLKDCYVKWPQEQVEKLALEFYQQLVDAQAVNVNEAHFLRWFHWMGLQRHIKVLGIFCRLYHRDKKAGYLADLPRVLGYVVETCRRYDEFKPLADWLEKHVFSLLTPEF